MAGSQSTAADTVRERLAPPALVVGLALGIVLALVLLFNPRSFLRAIKHSHASSVDLYFVKAVAQRDHDDAVMLLLARRETETGHNMAAIRILASMLAARPRLSLQERVRWLYYQDLLAVNYRYRQGSLDRERNEQALRSLIGQLRPGADRHALRGLAREALAVHDDGVAVAIYRDLAHRDGAHRSTLYALAATATLGLHHPREAARLYFSAQAYAPTPAAATRYFLAALAVLQSHDQVALALREGRRHLAGLAYEPTALRRLIALARAADEPYVAAYYARRLLLM